jgi:CRP/FNR family transcriptional activator FtrB
MRDSEKPLIRELQLFADMDEANFEQLMHASYWQQFPPQVELIAEGGRADFLHVVTEGCVELYAASNGRETTLALIRPVTTFILAAVLKDAVHLMSGRTTEASRVLMIPSKDIRAMMDVDSHFSRAIIDELATGFRSMVKRLKNQKLRNGVERLANYLLLLHAQQGHKPVIELRAEKKTIASLLGMTPENLSRAFATLGPYGVTVDGNRVELRDVDDLRRLAKPSDLIDSDRT